MKHKQLRKEEAEARQKKYNVLTSEQKVELIGTRRGQSKKELFRLTEQKEEPVDKRIRIVK